MQRELDARPAAERVAEPVLASRREAAEHRLRLSAMRGLLSLDEYGDRLGRVLAARTVDEVEAELRGVPTFWKPAERGGRGAAPWRRTLAGGPPAVRRARVVLALVLSFAAGTLVGDGGGRERVVVPEVAGLGLDDAADLLQRAGLDPVLVSAGEGARGIGDRLAGGTSPGAGSLVEPGEQVDVLPSERRPR